MMDIRRFLFLSILLVGSQVLYSQILQPATWEIEPSKTQVKTGEEIELIFRAEIDPSWYLYSSDFDPDLGPMLTEFNFQPNDSYELVGEIVPVNPSKKYDEIWEGEVKYFKGTGEFRQKVKIIRTNPTIRGSYSYQVCSDIDGKCIPFEDDFSFENIQVVSDDEAAIGIATRQLQLPDASDQASQQTGILEPATWAFEKSIEKPLKGDQLDLIFKADIDENWYLYSSDVDLVPGPIPATFVFQENDTYELVGEIQPIGAKEKYDKIFEGEVTYFESTAEFRQTVRILKDGFTIEGSVEYQVCSDIDGKCIPFEEDFVFGEKTSVKSTSANGEMVESDQGNVLKARDSYSPYSLWSFMVVAFLAGLAALFTPCVFPMIPMTVTFFTGRAKSRGKGIRNAFFYGFSIILIYTIIGSVVAPFMGPEMANELATNWIPNLIFFLVFVIFALSFFGLFEITLPSSWVNKADQQADKGGIAGIFFMAFTLVLVSFSCTGPIVGSILVEAAGGLILKPILGMLAFAMAFAIPFTLFAIFPEWLNSLPKSGGWLNSVKVVLGFVELAFALKFISVADQAYHWGLLDREVYLAFWIVIFALLGFYLLGKIRLPHDSKLEVISVPRLILAILVFTFVAYLVPGMFGAPLKALAGYLPPMSTHDFNLSAAQYGNLHSTVSDEENLCDEPKYADFLHFPHGIKGYFDYEQALDCSGELDKPVFIDFTGHGCVNCREMEARVWSDPAVLSRLKDDFVVLALYVDDKTELPESEWYTSSYDDKVKKTIGKQNADLQITRYNNNAQPFYLIVDSNGESMVEPKSYDLDVNHFVDFLEAGKEAYEERK